ncbi:hypothetical protein LUZ60_000216 [Juncus effusus]|nr:hypothetical protein LUZ60_000216 [Juncus effusus]
MAAETDRIPSSPTNSSPSSSDLDTESTGSFFPDRSTTLGTLMGVRLNPSQPAPQLRMATHQTPTSAGDRRSQRRRRRRRKSGWWRLCRDDNVKLPKKLGEFLEVERRMNNGVVIDGEFGYNGGEIMGEERREEGRLFENGRVLPPVGVRIVERNKEIEVSSSRGRLPILITGICSGGEG